MHTIADSSRSPFIVLEGIDGAGTTTQSRRLAAALRSRGLSVLETREPSDGPIGAFLRQILRGRVVSASGGAPDYKQLALLFAADRLDHVDAEILPSVSADRWVVCDRYDYSSVAYQSGSAGSTDAIPWLRTLNEAALRPDLTLVLDVSADVARGRRLARAEAREIFDDDAFQGHLAQFYRSLEQYFERDKIVHVDGDGPADEVFEAIWAQVSSLRPWP